MKILFVGSGAGKIATCHMPTTPPQIIVVEQAPDANANAIELAAAQSGSLNAFDIYQRGLSIPIRPRPPIAPMPTIEDLVGTLPSGRRRRKAFLRGRSDDYQIDPKTGVARRKEPKAKMSKKERLKLRKLQEKPIEENDSEFEK